MIHLLRAALVSAIAVGLALLPHDSRRSEAAAAQLFDSYACTAENSDLIATFSWAGNDPTALQQWVDVSPLDNGWQPGTFFGVGPFAAAVSSVSVDVLPWDSVVFVRVNQLMPSGIWEPSPTFEIVTSWCGNRPDSGTITGAFAAARAGGSTRILVNVTSTENDQSTNQAPAAAATPTASTTPTPSTTPTSSTTPAAGSTPRAGSTPTTSGTSTR